MNKGMLLLVATIGLNLFGGGATPLTANCEKDCGTGGSGSVGHRGCTGDKDCHVTLCNEALCEEDSFDDNCGHDHGWECTSVYHHDCDSTGGDPELE